MPFASSYPWIFNLLKHFVIFLSSWFIVHFILPRFFPALRAILFPLSPWHQVYNCDMEQNIFTFQKGIIFFLSEVFVPIRSRSYRNHELVWDSFSVCTCPGAFGAALAFGLWGSAPLLLLQLQYCILQIKKFMPVLCQAPFYRTFSLKFRAMVQIENTQSG